MPTTIVESVYVEGLIELKNGKVFQVRRKLTADKTYSIVDEKGGGITTPTVVPVAQIQVNPNMNADKVAPQAVSFEADPPKVERCEKLKLALTLSDDRALPPSQQVKVWLGPDGSSKLMSATLTGGTRLVGDVQLPQDAPSGVWYAFPEKVSDLAGNEAIGTLTGGKFTLSGVGTMPTPVMAATFIVPSPPNMPQPTGDLGVPDMAPPPDMASALPATLSEVGFMATVVTGLYWLAERFYFLPKRRQSADALAARAADEFPQTSPASLKCSGFFALCPKAFPKIFLYTPKRGMVVDQVSVGGLCSRTRGMGA